MTEPRHDQPAAHTSCDSMIDAYRQEIATQTARVEELEDAIRDMLDFTVGWCRPMTATRKLSAIRAVGEKVLDAE